MADQPVGCMEESAPVFKYAKKKTDLILSICGLFNVVHAIVLKQTLSVSIV